ncbi:hypothetical protein DFH09DRAFT_1099938 [Mycena vulgaris]|nr:hypothetical protein DFH09DRAFT_1099938 [Mycena vulgaris]
MCDSQISSDSSVFGSHWIVSPTRAAHLRGLHVDTLDRDSACRERRAELREFIPDTRRDTPAPQPDKARRHAGFADSRAQTIHRAGRTYAMSWIVHPKLMDMLATWGLFLGTRGILDSPLPRATIAPVILGPVNRLYRLRDAIRRAPRLLHRPLTPSSRRPEYDDSNAFDTRRPFPQSRRTSHRRLGNAGAAKILLLVCPAASRQLLARPLRGRYTFMDCIVPLLSCSVLVHHAYYRPDALPQVIRRRRLVCRLQTEIARRRVLWWLRLFGYGAASRARSRLCGSSALPPLWSKTAPAPLWVTSVVDVAWTLDVPRLESASPASTFSPLGPAQVGRGMDGASPASSASLAAPIRLPPRSRRRPRCAASLLGRTDTACRARRDALAVSAWDGRRDSPRVIPLASNASCTESGECNARGVMPGEMYSTSQFRINSSNPVNAPIRQPFSLRRLLMYPSIHTKCTVANKGSSIRRNAYHLGRLHLLDMATRQAEWIWQHYIIYGAGKYVATQKIPEIHQIASGQGVPLCSVGG